MITNEAPGGRAVAGTGLRGLLAALYGTPAVILVALCALPAVLVLLGVDFGSPKSPLDPERLATMDNSAALESVFHSMTGSFTHTLLEWTASIFALFTVVLAFAHFSIKRDIVTPVIALALLAAGTMDAFHTLAADRLITATAENTDLIPFTWAICRTFNAVIPLSALIMLAVVRRWSPADAPRRSLWVVAAMAVGLGLLAAVVIQYCASSSELPQTMFPDATVTRPWDVYPLVVYAFSGFVLYPLFLKRVPSYFAYALWLSVIPDVATQLHMALGSTALFDDHFNIAHFLKIIAYLVPCLGLITDYVRTYQRIEVEVSERGRAEEAVLFANVELQASKGLVEAKAEALERSNADLEKFAYVASHDLQEPLRMVTSFTQLLNEEYGHKLDGEAREYIEFATDGAMRMSRLINDLLAFSRVGGDRSPVGAVSAELAMQEALDNVRTAINESGAVVHIDPLPVLRANEPQLVQVFQNLIGNAIKFRSDAPLKIDVTARLGGELCEIAVRDNGIGIEPQYFSRIFEVFQRLHTTDRYPGTGIGLALVNKIVQRHGGAIRVESTVGQGTTFHVTLPVARADWASPEQTAPVAVASG